MEVKERNKHLSFKKSLHHLHAFQNHGRKELDSFQNLEKENIFHYWEQRKERAATVIQAAWRGHRERRKIRLRAADLKREKAATVIQRRVRQRVFEKQENKKLQEARINTAKFGSELTSEQLMQYEHKIESWKKKNKEVSLNDYAELNDKVQQELSIYLSTLPATRKRREDQINLLTRLQLQADDMLGLPQLDEIHCEQDLDYFRSSSSSIISSAKQLHQECMKQVASPWFAKLD